METRMKKKLVVFTGAGVSAESGVPTFRDAGGLWENHKIEDVATPDGWKKDPELVLNFYNLMRSKLKNFMPNGAHDIIAELEEHFDVTVITQNIDDLHERAGSKKVIHLHGELLKSRSTADPNLKYVCAGNINVGDKCENGSQLRPDIVWFGENVYHLDTAASLVEGCDILLVVGTSLNVWPAAGLLYVAREQTEIYCIDPKAVTDMDNIKHIKKKAVDGMEKFKKIILNKKDKKESCCF
jgi:NAD-dependent deacetylase